MQISIQNFKLLNFYKLVFNFVFRGQTTSKTLALIFTSYNKQRSPKFKSYKIFLLTCMSLQLKRILHNEDLGIELELSSVLWNTSKGLHRLNVIDVIQFKKKHSLLRSECNRAHLVLLFPDSMYCIQFAV